MQFLGPETDEMVDGSIMDPNIINLIQNITTLIQSIAIKINNITTLIHNITTYNLLAGFLAREGIQEKGFKIATFGSAF